jgi:hypothetical protein
MDNRTPYGEHGKPGVPPKGDHVDATSVHNSNEGGNKKTGKRQDPKVHYKRFSKDQIKGDFLQHR